MGPTAISAMPRASADDAKAAASNRSERAIIVPMKPRDPKAKLDAWCNERGCDARHTGTRAELVALKWLPCARKGGKLEWKCAKCNPTLTPPSDLPARSAWTKSE